MVWFGIFQVFVQYYQELFPPCNVTVMRKQSGTPKVHVSHVLHLDCNPRLSTRCPPSCPRVHLSEVPVVRARVRHFDPRTTDYEPSTLQPYDLDPWLSVLFHLLCNNKLKFPSHVTLTSDLFDPFTPAYPSVIKCTNENFNLFSHHVGRQDRWSLPLPG